MWKVLQINFILQYLNTKVYGGPYEIGHKKLWNYFIDLSTAI